MGIYGAEGQGEQKPRARHNARQQSNNIAPKAQAMKMTKAKAQSYHEGQIEISTKKTRGPGKLVRRQKEQQIGYEKLEVRASKKTTRNTRNGKVRS